MKVTREPNSVASSEAGGLAGGTEKLRPPHIPLLPALMIPRSGAGEFSEQTPQTDSESLSWWSRAASASLERNEGISPTWSAGRLRLQQSSRIETLQVIG